MFTNTPPPPPPPQKKKNIYIYIHTHTSKMSVVQFNIKSTIIWVFFYKIIKTVQFLTISDATYVHVKNVYYVNTLLMRIISER